MLMEFFWLSGLARLRFAAWGRSTVLGAGWFVSWETVLCSVSPSCCRVLCGGSQRVRGHLSSTELCNCPNKTSLQSADAMRCVSAEGPSKTPFALNPKPETLNSTYYFHARPPREQWSRAGVGRLEH